MKTLKALTRGLGNGDGIRIPAKEDREPVSPEGSLDGLAVSEEEYWERYYNYCEGDSDFSYEWNNGYLEEKPVSDYESWLMYHWFVRLTDCFLTVHPIAKTMGLEFGFRLDLPRRKKSVRKPDLSVIRNDNPDVLHPDAQSYRGTFDMCIESLSRSRKSEILRDTVEKKREYQNVRVKEYFILDARRIKTAFYRLDDKGKYRNIVPENVDIVSSEVLPGFRFRISDLYTQPSLEKLSENPVYREYVLPFYQKARQEAESQRLRAEQEKLRADQSEKRFFEAARTMLANGLELERIMKYTGLSAEELGKLSEAAL
ncbi:MAG: Uma2 family endonuclease [Desulfococcaceae bacterium]